MGQSKTGSGQAIPVTPQGNIDINALIAQTVDRRKKYFYDQLTLTPGTTVSNSPYGFFSTALNQPDPNNGNIAKTMLQTNCTPPAGQFNPPYDLIIMNLGFMFYQDNRLYDIMQIVKGGWFEFKILEKVMWNGNLLRNPPGMGISGYSTQTSESAWNNGIPEPGSIWYFGNYMKYIPPLVNFTLTLNFPQTQNNYYNSALPANLIANSASGTALPTLLAANQGGNGIQLQAILNGLSDGPVQMKFAGITPESGIRPTFTKGIHNLVSSAAC